MKLNLGSGLYPMKEEGMINLDIVRLDDVDVVWDFNKSGIFMDNQFEEIYAYNFLEHLNDIIKPMEEIWRIGKNGCKVKIKVPIYPTIWSMTDPTHKVFYTFYTFNYFSPDDDQHYITKARFKTLKKEFTFDSYLKWFGWIVNSDKTFQKFYYIFLSRFIQCREMYFELEVVK